MIEVGKASGKNTYLGFLPLLSSSFVRQNICYIIFLHRIAVSAIDPM
jgi:hypothetical protein